MATEIERKFLVKNDSWLNEVKRAKVIEQAYLHADEKKSIRVRIGEKAFICVKSPTEGLKRKEWEYQIPIEEAMEMMETCGKKIIKKRHFVYHEGFTWEIDVFQGDNEGLIVAEIELPAEDTAFPMPSWAGKEVTTEDKYLNMNLVNNPYKNWPKDESTGV
jgi:adenylate cyclase